MVFLHDLERYILFLLYFHQTFMPPVPVFRSSNSYHRGSRGLVMKMKNIVFLTLLVGIIILFFVGIYTIGDPEDPYCTVDNGRGDMSQSIERLYVQPIERHLRIDTVTSVIVWRDMVLGEYCHGLLPFSSGRLVVSDSNLISVYAEIAMDKLSIVHPPKHTGLKIRDYLLSPDSWDAKLYPKAYFELSDIPAIGLPLGDLNTIQGKLTMCGITQRVTIPIEAIYLDGRDGSCIIRSEMFRIRGQNWSSTANPNPFTQPDNAQDPNDGFEISIEIRTQRG